MIIATNKAKFSNQADAATGTLRSAGAFSMGANDLFLGFKPAAVCKRSGYLRVTGTGSVLPQLLGPGLGMYMVFSRPGVDSFRVKILQSNLENQGLETLFSFHVDIPVGTTGHSELDTALSTLHANETSTVYKSWAYITADPDDIWCATFYYESTTSGTFAPGRIKIETVIAEYKEN